MEMTCGINSEIQLQDEMIHKDRIYKIERLDTSHFEDILDLCQACETYFHMDKDRGAEARDVEEILTALPPGTSYSDKNIFGCFNSANELIGLMDIVKNYPDKDIWVLGLLLIHPDYRRHKIGHSFYRHIEKIIIKDRGKAIRIGVLNNNKAAFRFWESLSFKYIKTVSLERDAGVEKLVSVLVHDLV